MNGSPLNAVRSGLLKFVDEVGPQDKVAIQTIADEGRWDSDWGADSGAPHKQLRAAITGLSTRGNLTRLWDAMMEAIPRFPNTPISRRLIVISDGHDEGSTHSEQEVIKLARDRGVIVDAIGITREHHDHLENLAQLASATGGLFAQAHDNQELERLVGGGIQRLKTTPVVSFHLNNVRGDGKNHNLEITWAHDGVESKAVVSAMLPAGGIWKHWYWMVGIAAALLLLILVIAIVRSRRPGAVPVAVETPQSMPAPAPISAASIERPAAGPPKPFVAPSGAVGAQPLPPRKVFPAPGAPAQAGTARPGPARPGSAPVGSAPAGPAPAGSTPSRPARSVTKMISRFPAPSADRPGAWLVGEEGPMAGKRFAVDKAEFWVGSLDNNHLHIANDPTVSGNHACLIFDHDVMGIYDHHSTNGTHVNGEVIGDKRCLLRPGDRIKVGRSIFLVEIAGPPGAGV
jgi:hypothetical protein